MWGHLENVRQDRFSVGLLWNGTGGTALPREFIARLKELDDEASLVAMNNVHSGLLVCYAQDAWNSFRWLDDGWGTLTARWRGRESSALRFLIDLATAAPPEDSAASWLPLRSIVASLPALLALPGVDYARVNEKRHPISTALRAIRAVTESYPRVFPSPIHPAFAAACANFANIQQGATPTGFSIGQYKSALTGLDAGENRFQLEEDSYLPSVGDLLGPLHFRHAIRALEERYADSLAGNEIRRGQALGLARGSRMSWPKLDSTHAPRSLAGQRLHFAPWWHDEDETLDDAIAQQRENLMDIGHFVSWLAFTCRQDVRKPGMLADFLRELHDKRDAVGGPLAFLLQIGESLFAYYLLLWEVALLSESSEQKS